MRISTLTSTLACWAIIALIALGIPSLGAYRLYASKQSPEPIQIKGHPTDEPDFRLLFAGKYAVGTARLAGKAPAKPLVAKAAAQAKTPADHVAAAILDGEFNGPDAAIARLRNIPSPAAAEFLDLYQNKTPLPETTRDHFGFFAQLAESLGKPDADPARAAMLASATLIVGFAFAAGLAALLVFAIGLGLLITAAILIPMGKLRFPNLAPTGPAHIYLQAFTIYLCLLVGASPLFALISWHPPMWVELPLLSAVVLIAVSWPLIRRVPLPTLRRDWGIHMGSGLFTEIAAGLGGYIAGLPIVLVGALVALFLAKLTGADMSHPINREFKDHKLLMAFLAVIFAPITEELLFRGAFLSHIRSWFASTSPGIPGEVGRSPGEGSQELPPHPQTPPATTYPAPPPYYGTSYSNYPPARRPPIAPTLLPPLIAGALTAFIFAAIHPQGWAAIPALGTIGFVLATIRQWRGTLIASITAHAFNNGVITLMLFLALS